VPHLTVILDACVLYPAPVKDLLLQLACTGLFRARWTDAIHDEWIRNVLKNPPLSQDEYLDRLRSLRLTETARFLHGKIG